MAKCYFDNGQYYFSYGTCLPNKVVPSENLISFDDYAFALLSDTSDAGLLYVLRDGKYGVFTFVSSDNMGCDGILFSSNIYPFIYDEIWHNGYVNGSDGDTGIGYVAVRINHYWGVLRVEDHMLDEKKRARRRCMMIIPCIYPTREEAISFIKSKDYHPEYGWHNPIMEANDHRLLVGYYCAPAAQTTTTKGQKKSDPKVLRVTLGDGKVIQEDQACDTFIKAIQAAGVEKVQPLRIPYSKKPIICDTYSVRNNKKPRLVDGKYIFTHSSTCQKKDQLEYISNELILGWTVELI